jgi:cell division protein FtsZ
VLFNVTGGEDLGILEVYEAADILYKAVDPDANIIIGAVIDPTFPESAVKVTLIATGFDMNKSNVQRSRSYPGVTTHAQQQGNSTHQQPAPVAAPRQPAPQQQRAAPSFSSSEDLDIPPFLRNRNRGR